MFPFFEDRKEDITIIRFERLEYPMHLHGHVEILYIDVGEMRIRLDGDDIVLKEGDMAFFFPNTIHEYLQQDTEGSGIMLIASPSFIPAYGQELLSMYPQTPVLRKAVLHEEAAYCARKLAGEGSTNVQKAYLYLLLSRTLPSLNLSGLDTKTEIDVITRAVRYVSLNFRKPLTLAGVAQALGVNAYYLSHLFSGRLRLRFREYINALRVALAKQLLRGTSYPITQIGYECGFENLRTFDRVFRAQCGCSPRAFRAQGGPEESRIEPFPTETRLLPHDFLTFAGLTDAPDGGML